jgi:hypothetical protein
MVIEFTVSIEVDDVVETKVATNQAKQFDEMLSSMEEIVGKAGFSLNASNWEATEW